MRIGGLPRDNFEVRGISKAEFEGFHNPDAWIPPRDDCIGSSMRLRLLFEQSHAHQRQGVGPIAAPNGMVADEGGLRTDPVHGARTC
jgi:hypothetical protein